MEDVRLNKFLAERLGLSRRQADDAIARGEVTVNREPAVLGQRIHVLTEVADGSIDKSDEVCYNGKIVPISVGYTYIGMNKPVGYVCSRRQQGEHPTVFELLPEKYRELKAVGRLDRDSSGLILFTNDGDFAFQMTHPKFSKSKEYEVQLDSDLQPLHRQMISEYGIEIGDGKSQMALGRLNDGDRDWRVTISEGRNRQIRRTFAALGYEVVKLKRVRFGKYMLGDLKEGEIEEVGKVL